MPSLSTYIYPAFRERRSTIGRKSAAMPIAYWFKCLLGDIKDFETRGVNALEKPVKIDDLVECVNDIVEHKVPALK
jgi:hypothetical protein